MTGDTVTGDTSREAALLTGALRYQRAHVLGAVDGLSEKDLRRPVLPTGWSCLQLINHLALDVERLWFLEVMAGEPVEPRDEDGWHLDPALPAAEVLENYRRITERADAVIAAASLDDAPACWPAEFFPDFRMDDLRELLLHVITETACHAGHLDAARELIDGATWLILD